LRRPTYSKNPGRFIDVYDKATGRHYTVPEIRGGMPTGTGAVDLKNLPNVAFKVDPPQFFQFTERNVFQPFTSQPLGAPSVPSINQLLQVGVVSELRLQIKGVIQVITNAGAGGTTIVPTFKWPYGILSFVQLSGNGMNNFINASGVDLLVRQICQNRAMNDQYTNPGIGAAGVIQAASVTVNYPFQVQLVIPVAMDAATLIGSLYAQSEATNLTLTLVQEAFTNLFTIGTPGNVTTQGLLNPTAVAATQPLATATETFFEVPYDQNDKSTLIIPDLTVLHGFVQNTNPVASQNVVETPIPRINGQLERLIFWVDNAGVLVSTANILQIYLRYGAQETPYIYNPPDFCRIKNMEDYRVALQDGVYVLDMLSENPRRDQIIMEGVTNLRLGIQFISTFVPAAAAKVHYAMETLFA
jgi:hypothetical protein